jgi:short subunit dehydrogenase
VYVVSRNMKINGLTVLVTGANRGLGRAFVQALRDAGSSAAARCHDVGILINNAGVARFVPAVGAPTMDDARLEIETNYLGTLAMCRAFAPVLKRNGGGVLVNMLSVVSFFNAAMQGSYCASKAAEWSLTKAARELCAGHAGDRRLCRLHRHRHDRASTSDSPQIFCMFPSKARSSLRSSAKHRARAFVGEDIFGTARDARPYACSLSRPHQSRITLGQRECRQGRPAGEGLIAREALSRFT